MPQTPESSSEAIEKTTSAQFNIAGRNETSVIRGLTHINGISIARLEEIMQPSAKRERRTASVYLAAGESLIEVLAKDNDYVLAQGLTHQDLAAALLDVWGLALSETFPKEIEYRGERYGVATMATMGGPASPFGDDFYYNSELRLTHLNTGKRLGFFPGLLMDLINSYGFYEGTIPYRIEPAAIIAFFPHLQNKKPRVQ